MKATVRDILSVTQTAFAHCESVVIVASVQFGRHARFAERFVKRNCGRLRLLHSAFISVSGNAARTETRPEAEAVARKFFAQTGWHPDDYALVGGALKFTRYNFLLRFMIKRIYARKGVTIDPKRDYDFTDWDAVKTFAKAFVEGEAPH